MTSLQQQVDQLTSALVILNDSFIALQEQTNQITYYLDVGWVLLCSSIVILLQAGFTLLEIGGARIVNPKTTLIKVC
jgi:hypothetical protein